MPVCPWLSPRPYAISSESGPSGGRRTGSPPTPTRMTLATRTPTTALRRDSRRTTDGAPPAGTTGQSAASAGQVRSGQSASQLGPNPGTRWWWISSSRYIGFVFRHSMVYWYALTDPMCELSYFYPYSHCLLYATGMTASLWCISDLRSVSLRCFSVAAAAVETGPAARTARPAARTDTLAVAAVTVTETEVTAAAVGEGVRGTAAEVTGTATVTVTGTRTATVVTATATVVVAGTTTATAAASAGTGTVAVTVTGTGTGRPGEVTSPVGGTTRPAGRRPGSTRWTRSRTTGAGRRRRPTRPGRRRPRRRPRPGEITTTTPRPDTGWCRPQPPPPSWTHVDSADFFPGTS